MATVCDQGATNRKAISDLCKENSSQNEEPGSHFVLNNHNIFTIFDPPHLLKSTRNALLKYIIRYNKVKTAKMEHIRQCFNIDKKRRFQALRKLREDYLYLNLNGKNRLKMKVSVAARTLSHTVAACIEQAIGDSSFDLPADAIHTAEFIHDIDQLFDSFNGRLPKPELGKPYRRCLSGKSPHRALWFKLKPKIKSWEFISGNTCKEKMPFKSGWITTINATCKLWDVCQKLGFKFLRTRTLNQDPLENMFSLIRHLSDQNTNPNPYQLVSAFKTSVLTNLITPVCNRNCETDEGSILDNLHEFLDNDDMGDDITPLHTFQLNELDSLDVEGLDLKFTEHESNSAAYVAGFLIKKIKLKIQCEECLGNLITENLQPHHTFTMFKEFTDDKKRLTYVTKEVTYVLMRLHDIVMYILPKFGYITHLTKKIKIFAKKYTPFDWFTCK